jgi:hypothetical protein
MSATLTNLRLKMEHAEKESKESQQKFEAASVAFHKQARLEGVCPVCLKPDPQESHFGACYVTVAGTAHSEEAQRSLKT